MRIALSFLLAVMVAADAGSAAPAQTASRPVAVASADGTSSARRDPRRVLALYTYGADHPVTITFDAQFQATLRQESHGHVVRHAEYMETGRFQDDSQMHAMRDYLRQKYADRRIDVLFSWGTASLAFFLKNYDDLFPGVPIVYYVSTLEGVKDLPARPSTGVVNTDAYERTLELALSLDPAIKEVYVVTGTISQDKSMEREAIPQLARFLDRVKVTYLTDVPLEPLLSTVRRLPRHSIVLFSRQSQEVPGRALQPLDLLDPVSRASSVPVFSPWRSYLGSGTVGGVVDNPVGGATRAAEIVMRVARGDRPEDIPPERVPKIPTFDARQLARWGFSESRLPAGSVVLFRQPTLWSEYRSYIIGSGVLVVVQTLLIAGLLVQRTRRRRVEAALRESEERFRLMADTAPVMIWRTNRAGNYDFFNQPWLVFRGRSVEEEAGDGWTQGVHAADLDRVVSTFTAAFDGRRPFQTEYRLQRADGEYRWVVDQGIPRASPDGAFAGYIGSCFDITERKEAEAALRQSEKRYALATAAGAVGVWDWNLASGALYIEPAIRRALGLSDNAGGQRAASWEAVFPPEDAARLLADARACLDGQAPFFENEYATAPRDGSRRWFLIRGSAASDDGRVETLTGTATDITERKRAEADLEETRHEFARMTRVTSLAHCAAAIAHELSQPLASIQMNIGACLRWMSGPGGSKDDVESALLDIAEAAALANGVVTRERDTFRRHPVEGQALDANRLVHDMVSLVRTRLQQSGVRLDLTLDERLPPVRGDRVELQQVLLNLALNGIEAMDTIEPAARWLSVDTRLTGDRMVQTTVRDTGVGIQDPDRLFTPFYTTKRRGTGVGLSISRYIIERHGGRLWAEPDHRRGATFCFTVPIAADAHEPHGTARAEAFDGARDSDGGRPAAAGGDG